MAARPLLNSAAIELSGDTTLTVTLSGCARVVAVVAHPDDAEIMFYGALRCWRDAGATVTVVAATHGTNGVSRRHHDAGMRLNPQQRPAESARSFNGTGIMVECLGLADGALTCDIKLISAIEDALTRHGCTVLLTHAPHSGNDHQDHHAIARAALNAATRVPSCTTILHGQPHAPHQRVSPTVLIDITEYLDAKIEALAQHRSQAGRYYLSESYTRWRAAGEGWTSLPGHAATGRSFEAFSPSLLLLHGPQSSHSPYSDPPRSQVQPKELSQMTSSTPLPADLRQWVAQQLGTLSSVNDVSWPRDNSLVWRVTSDREGAYVKISPTQEKFTREVNAYYHAASFLSPDEAPRLLAAAPDLRAILTSPLAGVIVKDLALPTEQEYRVHELAGQLLRRWHTHTRSEVSESARDEAIASVTKRTDEAAAHLKHAGHRLTDAQRTMVEQGCYELPQLATILPLVFRHGDFAPRNWMWNPDHGTLALLDFEESSSGIAIEDFVWLFATTWPTHPHLKTACLTGFGRQFDEAEHRALILFAALAAMSYLNAGITQQEPLLVTKAQNAFNHLFVASG